MSIYTTQSELAARSLAADSIRSESKTAIYFWWAVVVTAGFTSRLLAKLTLVAASGMSQILGGPTRSTDITPELEPAVLALAIMQAVVGLIIYVSLLVRRKRRITRASEGL